MKKIIITFSLLVALSINAQEFSALTYNIKFDDPSDSINGWDNRKEFLISQLNYNKPDVFGTQEGLYHQLEDIREGLKEYAFFGLGRDKGDKAGEHTAIFYNTKRIKLLEESTFWLSETPDKPSKGWDAALNRVCTYGIFELIGTGKKVIVFNAHFDHIGIKAREESVSLILKKIAELNKDDLPVILMGDFNLENQSIGIQKLLKVLADAHIEAGTNAFGPTGTFNGFHFNKPVTKRIDYIFINKKIKVLKSGILSDSKGCLYPSDHFPVYTELIMVNN